MRDSRGCVRPTARCLAGFTIAARLGTRLSDRDGEPVTTNVYVHANLAMKEKALAKLLPMDTPFRRIRLDARQPNAAKTFPGSDPSPPHLLEVFVRRHEKCGH